MFGPVHPAPFAHPARIIAAGRPVDAEGRDACRPGRTWPSIAIPLGTDDGDRQMLPEATPRMQDWLHDANPRDVRPVPPIHGHMDAFVGRDAGRDVLPHVPAFLGAGG